MNKIKRILLSRTGMTLVELTASIGLSLFVIVAAATMYLGTNNILGSYISRDEGKQITDHLTDYIRDAISYATDMEISHSDKPVLNTVNHSLCFDLDGKVYEDGKLLYNKDYYGKHTFKLKIMHDMSDNDIIHMVILLDGENSPLYTRRLDIELINIEIDENKGIQYSISEYDNYDDSEYNSYEEPIYIYYRAD